mgnify:CR=1 FL=1|jgi:hypothetical protein
MVLKEAYRYQKFLAGLIHSAEYYLYKKEFVTTVEQYHERKKSNPDAENETVQKENPTKSSVDFSVNDLLRFIPELLEEKENLSIAINKAKNTTEIDIDASLSMNKQKQEFIRVLNDMNSKKSCEKTITGKGYKFNVNNEQVPYIYDVVEKTTIDFDRNTVKALIKKYSKETDHVSTILDRIVLTTQVDFDPKYDINDTLEELLVRE